MGRRREEWVRRPPGSKVYHYDFTLSWRDAAGAEQRRRFRGSCGTVVKRDAEAFAKQLRERMWREVNLGQHETPAPAAPMTLNQACGLYWDEVVVPRYLGAIEGEAAHRAEARHRRSGITKWYCREFLRVLGKETPLAAIDTAAGIRFVREMQLATTHRGKPGKPYAPGTILQMVVCLTDILRRARLIWKEPSGEIDTRELRRMLPQARRRKPKLTKAQARALVEILVPHARPIVELGIYTALRKDTLLHLAWEDVDLDQRTLTVVTKGVDGGKEHTMPLIDQALRLLVTYEPDPAKRTGRIWRFGMPGCACNRCQSRFGMQRKPIDNIENAIRKARAALGLPWLTTHSLRHAAASFIVDGDEAYLYHAQSFLGHDRAETTAAYASVGLSTLRRVAGERLDFMGEIAPQARKA